MVEAKQTSSEISEYKDIQISCYKNCNEKNSKPISIQTLFELIKTGTRYKDKISRLRSSKDKVEIDRLKKLLPAVTLSGLFNGGHKANQLAQHSGLIQIDIDKPGRKNELRERLIKDEFSFAVFDSPTQTGLKVIVKIQANVKTHLQSFQSLQKYYLQNFATPIDEKCKDVSRLMFLSFDESIFINTDSALWLPPVNDKQSFENMLSWLTKTKGQSFIESNRNNFIYLLTAACFRVGVSHKYALNECLKRYQNETTDEIEIKATVKSAYGSNISTQATTAPKQALNGHKTQSKDVVVKVKPMEPGTKVKGSVPFIKVIEDFITENYELRNNVISCKIECKKKGSEGFFQPINENNIYRELLYNHYNFSINKLKAILNSEFVKPFNPLKNYFESLGTWDGKSEIDFIDKLTEYIPTTQPEVFKKQFKKMLVRCIACALNDSVFNKQALIFYHAKQGTGKTTFCRWLCPPALKPYFAENIGTIDKDSQIALATNFLINMDELVTLSYSSGGIDSLKTFISKENINIRLPYDSRTSIIPRVANFIGSTNNDEFLTDVTGSSRWLIFELTGIINFSYKEDIDINDIWRQAFSLYQSGFYYQLTTEETLESERTNKSFQVIPYEVELIQAIFTPSCQDEEGAEFLNASGIIDRIKEIKKGVSLNPNFMGRNIILAGFEKSSGHINGEPRKGYWVKQIK